MGKGYRIEYDGAERYPISNQRKSGLRHGICLVLAGSALVISFVFPQVKQRLMSALIPGNDAVTLQAVEELTERLQSGENTKDALTAFCRTVIENGE